MVRHQLAKAKPINEVADFFGYSQVAQIKSHLPLGRNPHHIIKSGTSQQSLTSIIHLMALIRAEEGLGLAGAAISLPLSTPHCWNVFGEGHSSCLLTFEI